MAKTLDVVASETFSNAELPLTCAQERLVHMTKLVEGLAEAYPGALDMSLLLGWLSDTSKEVSTALTQVIEAKRAMRDEYCKN